MPFNYHHVILPGINQHAGGSQAVQAVPGYGLHGFERGAQLVRGIFIENAGAFQEIFGHRYKALHIAARVNPGIGVGFHCSLIG